MFFHYSECISFLNFWNPLIIKEEDNFWRSKTIVLRYRPSKFWYEIKIHTMCIKLLFGLCLFSWYYFGTWSFQNHVVLWHLVPSFCVYKHKKISLFKKIKKWNTVFAGVKDAPFCLKKWPQNSPASWTPKVSLFIGLEDWFRYYKAI